MRKLYLSRFFGVFCLVVISFITQAQSIGWNFTTASPSLTTTNITASDISRGNNNGTTNELITTVSVSSTYPGFSAGGNAGVAARTGALNLAANSSAYFEFTLTPANGYTFTLNGISFGTRSTSTAPQAYTIRSSADNFTTDIVSGSISNNSSWSLKSHTGLTFSASSATTFRIYGYNGTGSPAANTTNWRIDDLTLSVSASVPTNISSLSSLALSAGSLTPSFTSNNFSYSSTVPAAVNSITLTPVATDVLAAITVNNLPVANGNVSQAIALNTGVNNITIQVTAQDGITVSTYSIQVTREVPGNPLLIVNPASFDFGNQCINTTTNTSFTVNGTDLDGSPVTITAPDGFSVAATANGSFGSSIQLNYSGSTLNATTVYVRFTPVVVQSYQNNFNLSGGGTTLSYPAIGNGVNSTASVNTQLISNIGSTTATLAGDITNAGCSPASAYGFEYSTTNNFANGTGIVVTANNLSGNNFSAPLNGLNANTIYYVKAFVTNAGGTAYGPQQSFITTARPVIMAQQAALAYTQNFDNISSWSNGFASDNGAINFGPVAVNANGTIPNGIRTTTATNSFSSGSSGGVQRGSGSLVLLATGAADNTTAVAVDLLLDFTGVNAGTIAFNWASVNNSTGDRKGSLRIYSSTDGVNFTEITAAAVLNITNNAPTNGTVAGIALPSNFSNNPNARLRFYYHNGSGGSTGSRPKISIDNLVVRGYTPGDVTAPLVTSYNPATGSTGITPAGSIAVTFNETIVPGTGNITLHNATNGTSQVFTINDPAVSIAAETLSLNTNLSAFKSYYVTIDAGALVDLGGNAFAGIAANTWSFSTGAPPTSFNFNDCVSNLPGGFTQYSVTGAQVWGCTTFGKTGNGVQINGFVSGAQTNEDWLISPSFDLSGFDYPLLSFASRVRFAGPSLKLMVSSNYTGAGDPNLAQWTEINGRFAEAESDVWTTSDQIDLSAYKTANVYIAFVYTSSPVLNAARWTLDDFNVTNSAVPAAPGVDIRGGNIDFDYIANGQTSANRTFSVEGYNVSDDISVTAPTGFEISMDGNSFGSSVTIPAADANTRKTIYARFRPLAADQNYSGQVNALITNNGTIIQGMSFTGTSLRTLKVVNWNLEWFGSTEAGLGPNNKDLQQQNVTTVLNTLKADVYALVEIVDTLRFKNLAESLPGNYGYVVNTYGSYADDVNDPDYAGAQKLGFIYNKDVVKKLSSRPLLQASSGNAYNSWASGRFPFLMQAEVTLNGATSVVDFIVIHAKANTGNTADKIEGYQRRKAGADELKDSLDAAFPNSRIIILGDMNDDFDKTITTEMAPITASSYSSFLNDAANYTPVTLPLSLTGNSSTASFPDMIDHVITSSEMSIAYVQNSAKVYRDVLTLINGFASTTSDHFPIITKYDWRYFSKPTISVTDLGFFTDAGVCSITTTLPTPVVTGFNNIVSITSDAPQTFPVGVTKVTWTAVDTYGNSNTKEQLITVTDNQKPTIQAPAAVSIVSDNGVCYGTISSLGSATVADNCGIASVTNNAPAQFPVGTTIVTWTVTDIHGNITDTAKQEVTVIDNQPPVVVVNAISMSAQAGRCDAFISITQPETNDNCGIATITGVRNDGLPLTDAFPTGSTTITWTVTDVNGNVRIATQIVQVTDNQAPQIACAANLSFC
ncbi:cadherin-like beta sandwich domain-containing protein [Sediminibacterium sp.]|uniref:cadherin-like beta sandwich domain-containing protein n=1 Tax=Sediminibacterium sp. TaxID=1917865 RepID=UPI0025FC3BBD|nr:cadherin-like beta sandwich domain-containing protein [Sediminibacterium sp.]MBW0176466.1 Ig-like domain-containing protein [Sediminibacterium sp.]